jgi:F-type H+-transporting ATPase subunit a
MPSGLSTTIGDWVQGPVLAAGGIAPGIFAGTGGITNSLMVALIVMGIILLFTRMATRKMSLVPGTKQNLVEYVVEFLYGQVENIVGKKMAPKAFPLLATLFLFILLSNWLGLVPGVGTIGFGPKSGPLTIDTVLISEHSDDHGGEHAEAADGAAHAGDDHKAEADSKDHAAADAAHHEGEGDHDHKPHFTPLLRPATADLNTTLGMALVFMVVWTWITVREVGVWGFLVHTFGPKGGLTGMLKTLLIPIFLFVGVIEIISIVFRPISLSFRLLGNVYAGESLLHAMNHIGQTMGLGGIASFIIGVVVPIPFYFLEILVGLIQAIVFTLLCAVYIQLSTSEEEH